MKFKFLINLCLIYFLKVNLLFANFVYDKNNITITNFELNDYMQLYIDNYQTKLSKNEAIKNIVLQKKTIKFLSINNSDYLNKIDFEIRDQFGGKIFENYIERDFLRFLKIRNEFINQYFLNEFDIEDLKVALSSFKELKLPISINNCLTIERLEELKNNEYFINNFYMNLKNQTQNFAAIINNVPYEVCLSSNSFNQIESSIIDYIEKNTEKNFKSFIYGKRN